MSTVVVCGSRGFKDREAIHRVLDTLSGGTHIIHGDCEDSPDKIADKLARKVGLQVTPFPADWKTHVDTCSARCRARSYCRSAGWRRNVQMLDQKPKIVIAFWDGASPGTKTTIDEARRRGIPVLICEETT